jgi:hypothetical protein
MCIRLELSGCAKIVAVLGHKAEMVEAVWGWAGHGRRGSIANVGFSGIFNFFWVSFGDFGEKKRARENGEKHEGRTLSAVGLWEGMKDGRWRLYTGNEIISRLSRHKKSVSFRAYLSGLARLLLPSELRSPKFRAGDFLLGRARLACLIRLSAL